MNDMFLGYPSQKIIDWLRRTPPTPITGTDWTKVNEWLPTLEVGDTSISCPTCSGFMPITLQVVDKDTISCDGYDHTVTFQFNNVLTNKDGSSYTMAFNSPDFIQPNMYGYDSFGVMCSLIRSYLTGIGYPSMIYLIEQFMRNDDGSEKTGEDLVQANAFLNAIQTPTLSVAYYSGTVLQGQETFADKFWLPSVNQLGLSELIQNTEKEDNTLQYYVDFSEAMKRNVRYPVNKYKQAYTNCFTRTALSSANDTVAILGVGDLGIEPIVVVDHSQSITGVSLNICPCLTLAYND